MSNEDYIIARHNSCLKFQDIRVYRVMNVQSDHYLMNSKVLFYMGKQYKWKNENIIDGALEVFCNYYYII
jgi:hypothetical protein